MGYPETCDIGTRQKIKARSLKGNIELSVRPFEGSNAKVMLVGLNPTLVKGEIRTVFDLDNVGGKFYKYIVTKILKPCGLSLKKDIYATNLIKCTFPDEPRRICKKDGNKAVKNFLSPLFSKLQASL